MKRASIFIFLFVLSSLCLFAGSEEKKSDDWYKSFKLQRASSIHEEEMDAAAYYDLFNRFTKHTITIFNSKDHISSATVNSPHSFLTVDYSSEKGENALGVLKFMKISKYHNEETNATGTIDFGGVFPILLEFECDSLEGKRILCSYIIQNEDYFPKKSIECPCVSSGGKFYLLELIKDGKLQ